MWWPSDRLYSFPKPPATLLQKCSWEQLTGEEEAVKAAAQITAEAMAKVHQQAWGLQDADKFHGYREFASVWLCVAVFD